MATIAEALAHAAQFHQQGNLAAAEQLYRQVIAANPAEASALYMLGVLAHQKGAFHDAIAWLRQAIAVVPSAAVFHVNLAAAHAALRQWEEAIGCYAEAIRWVPASAGLYARLGMALHEVGRHVEAESSYHEALRLEPDNAEVLTNLAATLAAQGKLTEAEASYRQALQRRPDLTPALHNYGLILSELGKHEEALGCHEHALRLQPHDPAVREGHVAILNRLGNEYLAQGQLAKAHACYERAMQIKPDFAGGHINLGFLRYTEGRLSEAAASCERALGIDPQAAEAFSVLGMVLLDQGRQDEALRAMQRALDLKPDSAVIHSGYLNTLQYQPDITPEQLHRAHQDYQRRHAAGVTRCSHPNDRAPERRLRVGFVSPHFERHPVGYFLIGALERLDRREFEIVCYSDAKGHDDMTARFHAAAADWRDMRGKKDEQFTQQVQADRIDILVDLAGHTGGNRLLAFARKPAPIQITWLDYEGTTGLDALDYLLADPFVVPPGAELWYTEKILRMPHGFVCYESPKTAIEPGPLPARATGHVTFGSFNLLAKITPRVVTAWARILKRLPDSILLLKYKGLDDPPTAALWRERFAAAGVGPERVLLEGWSPYDEFLTRYQRVDIALDPFPYTGGLTTCEALWMGVPVITLAGQTFAGRHGASHLSNVGLSDMIAGDVDRYVELAVGLGQDLARLADLRAGLRQKILSSPLCDPRRFAQDLGERLRGVWRQWASQGGE
jgi:protein O-GlcNAc transferase